MAEKAYYTGDGVFNFDGKDYGFGAVLPDKVPNETVAALIKKGKASRTAPAQGVPASADETAGLRDQIKALTAQLATASEAASQGSVEIGRLQDRIAQMEKASIEREELIASLTSDLAVAHESLAASSAQAQVPPPPPAPEAPAVAPIGAGPKK